MRTLAVALAFCAALAAQPVDDLDRLFHAHQWFELRSAVTDRSPSLMRAAVATAFNDPETAERLLRNVIRSAPASNAADEAYGMLSQIYLRSGQYRRWLTSYRQWVAAIPDSARARAEEEDENKLAGRPDQVNGRPRRAVLRHDAGDFTIPVSVDGKVDEYVFDTGAWTSGMTERRAARLGLTIDATRRAITGSSGQSAGFRTAIAKEVDIGGTSGLGPAEVLLRPATITLQRIAGIGGECCVGNAGEDLLEQGFTIDFSAMTLRLSNAKD